jgi:alpha 1,3-mannosyltransferase
VSDAQLLEIDSTVQRFLDHPIEAPYKYLFSEVGHRAGEIGGWMQLADQSSGSSERKHRLEQAVEIGAQAVFPFLTSHKTESPLADLRASFGNGRGIVIPTGSKTLRFACHLIAALQKAVGSTLPIEIAYAGDQDLMPADRERLRRRFKNILFLDVSVVFGGSESILGIQQGTWATKSFAALASSFGEAIIVDADAVFLRPPETFFDLPGYKTTGTFFFHDRLLWQHDFQPRHEWWQSQITRPSAALNKSLVWTEDYAEEGDSGVVVLDKSRPEVVAALLHVCWQNTKAVRDEVTYAITYGDKESWWFGFELTGTPYVFEEHYGSMIGWPKDDSKPDDPEICSFTIAHVDDQDKVMWYNGGLLKNKKVDERTFGLPTHWMVDGTWKKGADRIDMSCMVGKPAWELSAEETALLEQSIRLAREIDDEFGF